MDPMIVILYIVFFIISIIAPIVLIFIVCHSSIITIISFFFWLILTVYVNTKSHRKKSRFNDIACIVLMDIVFSFVVLFSNDIEMNFDEILEYSIALVTLALCCFPARDTLGLKISNHFYLLKKSKVQLSAENMKNELLKTEKRIKKVIDSIDDVYKDYNEKIQLSGFLKLIDSCSYDSDISSLYIALVNSMYSSQVDCIVDLCNQLELNNCLSNDVSLEGIRKTFLIEKQENANCIELLKTINPENAEDTFLLCEKHLEKYNQKL